jgi:hypothetical protein
MPSSGSGKWIHGLLGGLFKGKNNLGNVWSASCEFLK